MRCQEVCPKFVSYCQLRIKARRDLQQGCQQLVVSCADYVFSSKVLNRTCPVNISQQSVVPQAEPLHNFWRRNVKDLIERGLSSDAIEMMQSKSRRNQADQ